MKKIFFVSSGEYSDYTIHGVFETKELAEYFLDKGLVSTDSYDPYDIEEVVLITDEDERFMDKIDKIFLKEIQFKEKQCKTG